MLFSKLFAVSSLVLSVGAAAAPDANADLANRDAAPQPNVDIDLMTRDDDESDLEARADTYCYYCHYQSHPNNMVGVSPTYNCGNSCGYQYYYTNNGKKCWRSTNLLNNCMINCCKRNNSGKVARVGYFI